MLLPLNAVCVFFLLVTREMLAWQPTSALVESGCPLEPSLPSSIDGTGEPRSDGSGAAAALSASCTSKDEGPLFCG
uniref:Putative secreted protein n=1 Tax=Ixodes ricinus TaxID=34613 RepID=A0A147BKK4_IXORI